MSAIKEYEVALEAILFVSAEPVSRQKLLEVFDEAKREKAAEALEALLERYQPSSERGIYAEEVAGGLRIVTRPELNSYLRRFFEVSGKNKLSMAALETLAIVAYRQPITCPEVQELRGVSSSGVIKTLLEKRLVRITGRKEVVGKPFLYGTTREFLMHFGLHKLAELPPLEEFEEALGLDGASLGPQEDDEPDFTPDGDSPELGGPELDDPDFEDPDFEDPEFEDPEGEVPEISLHESSSEESDKLDTGRSAPAPESVPDFEVDEAQLTSAESDRLQAEDSAATADDDRSADDTSREPT